MLNRKSVEAQVADIIWDRAPIASGEISKICEQRFSWKKTTFFTVLKRLCDKGLFKNENGVVTVVVGREQFYAKQSEIFLEENFEGSLPSFLAAFTSRKKLSKKDVDELRHIIAEYEENNA